MHFKHLKVAQEPPCVSITNQGKQLEGLIKTKFAILLHVVLLKSSPENLDNFNQIQRDS